MRAEIWRWWEKAVGTAVFSRIFSHLFPPFRSISHLFPPFPTSFLFYGQAERVGKWGVGLSERWGGGVGRRGGQGGGFMREKVRIGARRFTEVRESSHRSGP